MSKKDIINNNNIVASNGYGIDIYHIEHDINDTVYYKVNNNKYCKAKINYSVSSEAYFNTCKGKVYLNECIRTDI